MYALDVCLICTYAVDHVSHMYCWVYVMYLCRYMAHLYVRMIYVCADEERTSHFPYRCTSYLMGTCLIRMTYTYALYVSPTSIPYVYAVCICRWRAHLIHYRGILEEIHDCWQWVELSKKFILRHGTCQDDPSRSNTTITCDPTTLTYTDILPHLRRLTGYESFTFGTTVSTFRNGMRCHQQLQMSHPQRKQASLLIHRPSSNTRLTVLSRLWLALYTS